MPNMQTLSNLISAADGTTSVKQKIKYYVCALTYDNLSGEVHFNLAKALMDAGRPREALGFFLNTVLCGRGDAEMARWISVAHEQSGYDKASRNEFMNNQDLWQFYQYFVPHQSDLAPALLHSYMNSVQIELSSYCNRECSYCPNSLSTRRSTKQHISDDTFNTVLSALSAARFKRQVCFHRYNEPLAERDYFIDRLRQARRALPEATLAVVSNGDYLDADYLRELSVFGCNSIVITLHGRKQGGNAADDSDNIVKFLEKNSISNYAATTVSDGFTSFSATFDRMSIVVQRRDFSEVGYDRGGLIPSLGIEKRSSYCYLPFASMEIAYDGVVLPCCNVNHDFAEHEKYIIGKIASQHDVWEAYCGERIASWRRALFGFSEKAAPCDTCRQGVYPYDEAVAVRRAKALRALSA
jgi:hypothetical protein